ncbi:hypothetical protein O181_107225 [Austropuccinia psidii MF-1]|uniref:Uncharacterized protein n=1 Tax=Austropuccinia psidii MF-1 TaxID=1389203 RepID=A0A9Q3JQ41_9BASI|nr:hypothetical protein [Austropuccinia psidii MF-1]
MLFSIQEGHHNYCLFDPITGSLYISHDCVFKNKEAFWPSHSSSTPTLVQEPLLLPSLPFFDFFLQKNNQDLANKYENVLSVPEGNFPGDSSRSPYATPILNTSSNVKICSEAGSSSSTPPLSKQISSITPFTSSLPNINRNPLPKGWTYDFVPVEVPQNFDSNISNKSILSGGWSHKSPSCFAGVVISKPPGTFEEAMTSSKSESWMRAIQNKFSIFERRGVLEEVKPQKGLQNLDTTWVFREKTDSRSNVI